VRLAVTGTPGTGKTTVAERADVDLEVVHLNDVVHERGLTTGHDEERDSAVADLAALAAHLDGREDVLFESHLAHHFEADRVAVLRCHPEELAERLHDRGEPPSKVDENAGAEALDVVLAEAVERHGEDSVYEIDTTDATVEETAAAVEAVVAGERDPAVGVVSFVDYLE
jgi:adenylate kinase